MIATIINVVLILLGSFLGLVFKNRISARFASGITFALGLCTMGIGITGMISTADTLCVIVCMVIGTLIGEAINIEGRMDGVGELLHRKLLRKNENSRFLEGFVTASVLFCVGAMAINGAMEAGMNGNYDILISKSVMDGVTAITFSAAMGVGVAFSALPILVYEGGMTIIFGLVGMLFFCQFLGLQASLLAGSLTLVIMTIPTIIRTTQESLKTVPQSYREAALGLGAGKWHMIRTVVLPSSVDGIVTGCILSIGRIVGESAALLFTAGMGMSMNSFFSSFDNFIHSSGASLTVALYVYARERAEFDVAFAIAAILMILTLLINLTAKLVGRKLKKK